jgi:lipopolysaccharide transport system ATP-binding protein
MSDVAIRAAGLAKRYRIGARQARYKTIRESLTESLAAPFVHLASAVARAVSRDGGARADGDPHIWALKDVSFEIGVGEVVGIIGRNGAGKSTLLKILSRITEPTAGQVEIFGRVGSLLEVGTGFHPELTGRENIYLNGAILGMPRREIHKRFDEIVAFSEVEAFIDTPMKHYSSGMYMRLAFAVAAHLEPDILLVDEVLAVGDAAFQKKCLGKMGEVARAGRTVVFVSHDMAATGGLTRQCIWLDGGRISAQGATPEVVERYLGAALARRAVQAPDLGSYRRAGGGDASVRITAAWVNARQAELPAVEMGEDFSIMLQLDLARAIHGAHVACVLKDSQGRRAVTFFSPDHSFTLSAPPGRHLLELRVRGLPLAPGHYLADLGVTQSTGTAAYDVILDYPLFEIVTDQQVLPWRERPWGTVHWTQVAWSLGPAC